MMGAHLPITDCATCDRQFRPAAHGIAVCPVCAFAFVATGIAPSKKNEIVKDELPSPPSLSPLLLLALLRQIEAQRKPDIMQDPNGLIIHYPTQRGICAHRTCQRPFDPFMNQRYCSSACRASANIERRLARYGRY